MYREPLKKFYQEVERALDYGGSLSEVKKIANEIVELFLNSGKHPSVWFTPGSRQDLLVKTPTKVVSLRDYRREHHKCSPAFIPTDSFHYRFEGYGIKKVEYPQKALSELRPENGFGLSVLHEAFHARNHKDEQLREKKFPYDYAILRSERKAWQDAIAEVPVFQRNTGLSLVTEFDPNLSLVDYANLFLITYLTKSALKDILLVGEYPLIQPKQ